MRNQNFSTFPQWFFPSTTFPIKTTNKAATICVSSVWMLVEDISSMRQNYINCQKLHWSSCVLTAFCIPSSRENKISQTAQTLGSHIYSRNIVIPRLWHDISRFLMHLFDKNILLMKHWKCKVCLHFWLLLCKTGRHSNCFSYSTTGWASDRLVGVTYVSTPYFVYVLKFKHYFFTSIT